MNQFKQQILDVPGMFVSACDGSLSERVLFPKGRWLRWLSVQRNEGIPKPAHEGFLLKVSCILVCHSCQERSRACSKDSSQMQLKLPITQRSAQANDWSYIKIKSCIALLLSQPEMSRIWLISGWIEYMLSGTRSLVVTHATVVPRLCYSLEI